MGSDKGEYVMTEKYDDEQDKANDELKNIVAQPHPGEDIPQDEDE